LRDPEFRQSISELRSQMVQQAAGRQLQAERIVVGLSGGVDSSVAAALLVEQGVDVVGVTLRVWPWQPATEAAQRFGSCCSTATVDDARQVARRLGIPYYLLNSEAEFDRTVIEDFPREYGAAGLLSKDDEESAIRMGLAARLAFALSASAVRELPYYRLRLTPTRLLLEVPAARLAARRRTEAAIEQLRSDIPVHLPAQMKAEALELRNRLLHFRLCHFFKMQTDVSALMQGVDPRVNQTALSLLSVIDDLALRKEVQQALIEEDAARQSERQDTAEARVLAATRDAFAASQSSRVPLREITERFNSSYRTQYGSEMTHRWIGHILRKQFRVRIHKSKGIYVLDGSERAKVEALAANMGL
jgi:hypothetical protein